MSRPNSAIQEELDAMPDAPGDADAVYVEEETSDAFDSDLTNEFALMDDEFGDPEDILDSDIDHLDDVPLPEDEDEAAEVVTPPEEPTVTEEVIATPEETGEATPIIPAPSTDEQEVPALQLTSEEIQTVLRGRGTSEGEVSAPADAELETSEREASSQQAYQRSYDHYVEAYAMSEEDAARLYTEPEQVMPQLAASVTMQTIQAVVGLLPQMLPGIMQAHSQREEVATVKSTAIQAALGGVAVSDEYMGAAETLVRSMAPKLEAENPKDFALATVGVLQQVMGVKPKPAAAVVPKPGRRGTPPGARSVAQTPPIIGAPGENVYEDFADQDLEEGI